jgi:ferritin-like metal-binding protein YciE
MFYTTLNLHQFEELFILKFREIYQAETRILDILALLHLVAKTDELKETIMVYYRTKGNQIDRIHEIFLHVDHPVKGKNNMLASNMLEFCKSIASKEKKINEAELAEVLMELSHFFHCEYLWLRAIAVKLSNDQIIPLLDLNLEEEWRILERLKNSSGSTS